MTDFGVTVLISNKRAERFRSESDLTHTSGVVYLLPLVARGLVKEHSDRLGRVALAVSICYYRVAQTGLC